MIKTNKQTHKQTNKQTNKQTKNIVEHITYGYQRGKRNFFLGDRYWDEDI